MINVLRESRGDQERRGGEGGREGGRGVWRVKCHEGWMDMGKDEMKAEAGKE